MKPLGAALVVKPVGTALAVLIRLYQLVLRPLLPPSCRFEPSCSAYAIEALRTHGAWHGGMLASWRIVRCNPFCAGGLDPVPPASGTRDRACAHAHPPRLNHKT